jgi:hypothetical protein
MADPEPGTVQLYPLRVGELLDKAFRIYRQRFWLLLAIALVVTVPQLLIELPETLALGSARYTSIISGILSLIAEVALVAAVSHILLGQPASFFQAYKEGLRRFLPVLGAYLIFGVVLIIAAVVMGVLGIAGAVGSILALIVFVPLAFYLSTRWTLYTAAIVLENKGVAAGLDRSWQLTDAHFWRVLGTSIAMRILVYLIASFPAIMLRYAAQAVEITYQTSVILNIFLQKAGEILATPFSICVTVLIYYDLRIRKEGFDLEYMAQQVPVTETSDPVEDTNG